MSKFTSRRSIVLGAILTLVVAGAAVAYWTAGGSGAGSASAGTTSALTANQTSTLAAMYPGDSAQNITGTFDNPNSGPIRVNSVTASISSVTKAAGAPAGTCDATDFTLANPAMTVGTDVPVGTGVGAFSGATIKFNNKASNQDACKGATVNLGYAIS